MRRSLAHRGPELDQLTEREQGPWLAIVALAFGIVMLPWGMRRTARNEPDPSPFE